MFEKDDNFLKKCRTQVIAASIILKYTWKLIAIFL